MLFKLLHIGWLLLIGVYGTAQINWVNCTPEAQTINTYPSTSPFIGDTIVMMIVPESYADTVHFTVDFRSYTIPDMVAIICGDSTFVYNWIGDNRYHDTTTTISGYAEYYNHELIMSDGKAVDVPYNFYFGVNGYKSSFRSNFDTISDTVWIAIISNPVYPSKISIFIQCVYGFVEPDIVDTRFYVPDAFSPNGDGINDTFYPMPDTDYELSIYDRWGNLVYKGNTPWDGIGYKPDIYVYLVTTSRSKLYGEVTLMK